MMGVIGGDCFSLIVQLISRGVGTAVHARGGGGEVWGRRWVRGEGNSVDGVGGS